MKMWNQFIYIIHIDREIARERYRYIDLITNLESDILQSEEK